MLNNLALYLLIPVASVILGSAVAVVKQPSRQTESYVQHMAAGIVFAALAGEVLPDLTASHPSARLIVLGFAIGVGLMLVIRWATESRMGSGEGSMGAAARLLFVAGIDLVVDGLLIGMGVVIGEINGLLLLIALTTEILFLGLATATSFSKIDLSRWKVLAYSSSLAIPFVIGGLLGAFLFQNLSHTWLVVVLSFASAALLFLVTEELLVEAHEVRETPISAAFFYLGFVALYILDVVIRV